MDRRSFFALLFTPLLARFLPKPKPVEHPWANGNFSNWPEADLDQPTISQMLEEEMDNHYRVLSKMLSQDFVRYPGGRRITDNITFSE